MAKAQIKQKALPRLKVLVIPEGSTAFRLYVEGLFGPSPAGMRLVKGSKPAKDFQFVFDCPKSARKEANRLQEYLDGGNDK